MEFGATPTSVNVLTLEAGTACVQDNQRRHDLRLGILYLPDCFL